MSAHPDHLPPEGPQAGLLRVFLETAVPMWAAAAAAWPSDRRAREASQVRVILEHGADALLQPDHTPAGPGPEGLPESGALTFTTEQAAAGAGAGSAEIFDAIAKGLGLSALQPGGVTWLGRHWCAAPHGMCPGVIPASWLPARPAGTGAGRCPVPGRAG